MKENLIKSVKYLNEVTIPVCDKYADGRTNSVEDENTIITLLKEKYGEENIEVPTARNWYDVRIFGYPVNIKSSTFKGNDNFSAKAAILYSLTNLSEKECMVNDWQGFQNALKNNSGKENNRDYYCVVLNKNTNEVHLIGLKELQKISVNGNNLPFQINWGKNTNPVKRTYSEAYDLLVGTYKESVRKKVGVHSGYEYL